MSLRRWHVLGPIAVLACLGPMAASAAEIVAVTRQINPKTDPAGAIVETALVPAADGGFTAVWGRAKGRVPIAVALYGRSYDASLAPSKPGARFDAPIDGVEPSSVTILGGVRLDDGRAFAAWDANFTSSSTPHNPELVGRALQKDADPSKAARLIDDTDGFVAGAKLLRLPDGRGLAYWSGGGDEFTGRFVRASGKFGPPTIDLSLSGGFLARPGVIPLEIGFLAFFATINSGEVEVFGQVYDADGLKEGAPFSIVGPDEDYTALGGVGLSDGRIVILQFKEKDAGFGPLKATIYSRQGARVTGPVKLLDPVFFNNRLPVEALPDGGFLTALENGTVASRRVDVLRFDGSLTAVGAVASTVSAAQLRRSSFDMLADGRAAVSYVVDDGKLFVAIVAP